MRTKVSTWAARRRGALWGAIVLLFAMVGTAGATAGAMLHLNVINTATSTTTLNSAVNGPVLQIANTNTAGGTSARGLAITVPDGRPPIRVNATAGKATNLDADKLDGISSEGFMGGDVTYVERQQLVPAGNLGLTVDHYALCPTGKRPLGGGVFTHTAGDTVEASAPFSYDPPLTPEQYGFLANGWGARVRVGTVEATGLVVYAICAKVGSVSLDSR